MVKLVDLATSGGRFDENFIVVGPKTDFTIVIVRLLTTLARPLPENVKSRGAAIAGPWRPGLAGPASPHLGNASQGEAAEDPGPYRADDASESGVGSMKSGGFTQLAERSEAGTVAGDSADEDDAVAKSKLVVRLKDPVYNSSLPHEKIQAWTESKAIKGDHVGNSGFLFGNCGAMPNNALERERVLMHIKRQPAQIVCLAEAEKRVVRTLGAPPGVGARASSSSASAVAYALAARPEFE